MIVLHFSDPNFVLMNDMEFRTLSGVIEMAAGELISLRRRGTGLLIGDEEDTALLVGDGSVVREVLLRVNPITPLLDPEAPEDFEIRIEENSDVDFKMSRLKDNKSFGNEIRVTGVGLLGDPS